MIGYPSLIYDPKDLVDKCLPWIVGKHHIRRTSAPDNYVVKYGSNIELYEAEVMHFVSTHTNLKVPKVIAAYVLWGITYIIMSNEAGVSLAKFWLDKGSSEADKNHVMEQLRQGFRELRSLSAEYIGRFDRRPCSSAIGEFCWECRDRNHPYGPYATEADFNEGIIEALERCRPELPPDFKVDPDANHSI